MKVGDLVWYTGFNFNRVHAESYGPRKEDMGIVIEYLAPSHVKVFYWAEDECCCISVNHQDDLRLLDEGW